MSVLEKATAPDVVKFTPAIVAALATVKPVRKLEPPVANVTPDPPAVRVVVPAIAPPVVTPFTVIVPAPAAVMFKAPLIVRLLSSALLRAKPPKAAPNDTFVPEVLVMLKDPAPVEMAPEITRSAATMVRF